MFGLLIVVGFIGVHWKLLLVIAVGVAMARWVRQQMELRREDLAAAAAEQAAIAARADQQHHEVLAGDEHGTYGASTAAMNKYRQASAR